VNKAKYTQLANTLGWQSHDQMSLTAGQKDWLISTGSLTKQLTEHAEGDFNLNLLSEEWITTLSHEAKYLDIPTDEQCLVREVELSCKGIATVYARSVITNNALEASRDELKNLGSIPLGHLLFKEGKADLSSREIAEITIGLISAL